LGPTAIAHLARIVANNNLRLRQIHKSPARNSVSRFDRFHRCDSPTCAALALGVHVGHDTEFSPINRCEKDILR
jgi:hypothetical protein